VKPIMTNPGALKRDAAVVIVATAALCWLIWLDAFTRLSGFLLVTALVLYIILSLVADQKGDTPEAEMHAGEGEIVEAPYGVVKGLLIALAGLGGHRVRRAFHGRRRCGHCRATLASAKR
jgi:cation:H+ antiporter